MLRQMSSQHAVTDAKGTLSEWTRLISLPLAFQAQGLITQGTSWNGNRLTD